MNKEQESKGTNSEPIKAAKEMPGLPKIEVNPQEMQTVAEFINEMYTIMMEKNLGIPGKDVMGLMELHGKTAKIINQMLERLK